LYNQHLIRKQNADVKVEPNLVTNWLKYRKYKLNNLS
jgi:hypothetical protein